MHRLPPRIDVVEGEGGGLAFLPIQDTEKTPQNVRHLACNWQKRNNTEHM